jgi:phosphoglycolate phosphatase
MKIFFDLDGTLIDSKLRLYNLFQKLVPQSILTYDEYWAFKMDKISHSMILRQVFNLGEIDIKLFEDRWMELIETENWLKFDRPFVGTTDHLTKLKGKGFLLYVVTARQFKTKVILQLELFGWFTLFEEILVTEQKNKKEDLIKPYIEGDEENWIIGDTGMDIIVGKKLGIKTVAVLSGFLNKEVLLTYEPDYILENIIEFDPANKIQFK